MKKDGTAIPLPPALPSAKSNIKKGNTLERMLPFGTGTNLSFPQFL